MDTDAKYHDAAETGWVPVSALHILKEDKNYEK